MKKHFYFLFVLCSLGFGATAQTIVVTPDSVYNTVVATEFETVGHAIWINTTSETITYKWTRQVQCITPGWQSLICDENACYLPTTNTKEITLAPGDTSKMDVHIRPNGIAGTAIVFIELYDLAYPNDIVVSKFYYNTLSCTTGTQDISVSAASISPNPASSVIAIEDQPTEVKNVNIFSVQGSLVKTFAANASSQYDVANMPEGVYIVRTTAENGRILSATRLMIVR